MSSTIPDRVLWAVETLAVEPDDRLLEIGCGPGVAISLIAERLDGGTISAIDRSPVAVERARWRNGGAPAEARTVADTVMRALEAHGFSATRLTPPAAGSPLLGFVARPLTAGAGSP